MVEFVLNNEQCQIVKQGKKWVDPRWTPLLLLSVFVQVNSTSVSESPSTFLQRTPEDSIMCE